MNSGFSEKPFEHTLILLYKRKLYKRKLYKRMLYKRKSFCYYPF